MPDFPPAQKRDKTPSLQQPNGRSIRYLKHKNPNLTNSFDPLFQNINKKNNFIHSLIPITGFDSMCNGKADGNYEVRYPNGEYEPNYFLQCSGGQANCQPCWPQSLEFSETCNQCLYSRDGKYKSSFSKGNHVFLKAI